MARYHDVRIHQRGEEWRMACACGHATPWIADRDAAEHAAERHSHTFFGSIQMTPVVVR